MKIYKVALDLAGPICALAMSASIARSQQKAALSTVQVHMVITHQTLSDSSEVILVMGHANCGAVKSTIQAKEVPGQISALYPHIQPAVDQAGANFEVAIKANAKIQAGLLRQASTVISTLVKENKLKVVAAYYDIDTGTVSLLE